MGDESEQRDETGEERIGRVRMAVHPEPNVPYSIRAEPDEHGAFMYWGTWVDEQAQRLASLEAENKEAEKRADRWQSRAWAHLEDHRQAVERAEAAESERDRYRAMYKEEREDAGQAVTAAMVPKARLDEAEAERDELRLQAEAHAQEARTQRATVHTIYQAVTEATGEPGDWNGARPVVEELERLRTALAAEREKVARLEAKVTRLETMMGENEGDLDRAFRERDEARLLSEGLAAAMSREDGHTGCWIRDTLGEDFVDDWHQSLNALDYEETQELREAREALAAAERRFEELGYPITDDFIEGVKREALYQRQSWGRAHDTQKSDADWFWLVGYLAGKALHTGAMGQDREKQRHRIIAAAAALANWHAARLGVDGQEGVNSNMDEWAAAQPGEKGEG